MITTKLECNSPVTFVAHNLLPAVLLNKPGLLAQGDSCSISRSFYLRKITLLCTKIKRKHCVPKYFIDKIWILA